MKWKLPTLLFLCSLLVCQVSAVVNVTYNQSFTNASPMELVLFVASLGILLLILSFVLRIDQGSDVVAVISPFPLLISAWQFLSIDVVSGYGVVTNSTSISDSIVFESHTWYTMYPEAIIMLVLFGISVLNIYRIVIQYRKPQDSEGDDE